jgi:predicted amidohydrolase YtcJ
MMDSETLFEQGSSAVENGLSLAIHAIGDHANHEMLKAYSQLREHEQQSSANSTRRERPLRHRLEHVQILHPDDIPSLASLDVIASMQPIHATSDYEAADRTEPDMPTPGVLCSIRGLFWLLVLMPRLNLRIPFGVSTQR